MTAKKDKIIPWSDVITNIQTNVLESLARYKFLTLSQLLRLGVGTTQYKYLWKQVASLRDRKRPLVKHQQFNTVTPKGKHKPERIEDLYYLTNAGVTALREELNFTENIRKPIGKKLAFKDYFHRRKTIDFQISLDSWARKNDVEVAFFHTYFEKTGANRSEIKLRAQTRIDLSTDDFFIPDAAFLLHKDQQPTFFLFELYRGQNVKRTINQLHKHGLAMARGFTHQAYQLPRNKSYRIILLFEEAALLQAVVERIKQQEAAFRKIERYFRLQTISDLSVDDFTENWQTLHGKPTTLF